MMQKITIKNLKEMKESGEKIACLTSYDASFAKIQDEAGIDLLLVGDSLGMVLQGGDNTLKVSISDMIYHSKLVSNVAKRAVIVTDMPFMSYSTPPQALGNAARLISEGGAHVVKIEGGSELSEVVNLLSQHGIPVCGHLGLTPQSIYRFGTYTVRAKEKEEAQKLIEDAKLLEEKGCFAIVLEKIPAKLASKVTKSVSIPIIGIGAGHQVDGQVLVLQDMLGMNNEFNPRFLRRYLNLYEDITGAVKEYISDIKTKDFPNKKEQY